MYPILFQFWLVFGSPIDLRASFDWKELRFRGLDVIIPLESYPRRLNRIYNSEVFEVWSIVSCEAFKLYKVNVFLVSPFRWHKSSRLFNPSIKLLKCVGNESQP